MSGKDKTDNIDNTTSVVDDNDQIADGVKKDPYYLTSSDNSGLIMTHVQLKYNNYDELEKAMDIALRTKKKIRICWWLNSQTKSRNRSRGRLLDYKHHDGFLDFEYHWARA